MPNCLIDFYRIEPSDPQWPSILENTLAFLVLEALDWSIRSDLVDDSEDVRIEWYVSAF